MTDSENVNLPIPQSRSTDGLCDLMPVYFHELTDEQWGKVKDSGMTWNEGAKRFKPPAWCAYPDAVDPLGCWSLIGRMVTGEDYCKSCDLYQTHNVKLSGCGVQDDEQSEQHIPQSARTEG